VAADFAALVKTALAAQERFSDRARRRSDPQTVLRAPRERAVSILDPWEKLWFFWGDERCVPKEHPDSNFKMAAESLLNLCPYRRRMCCACMARTRRRKAARDYEKTMRQFFRDSGFWPHYDLVLLGNGFRRAIRRLSFRGPPL